MFRNEIGTTDICLVAPGIAKRQDYTKKIKGESTTEGLRYPLGAGRTTSKSSKLGDSPAAAPPPVANAAFQAPVCAARRYSGAPALDSGASLVRMSNMGIARAS